MGILIVVTEEDNNMAMTQEQFQAKTQEHGYGEAKNVEFEPNRTGELHAHDFSAMLMVTSGQLTMGYESGPVTYGPGDWCEVAQGMLHSENSGPEGATALAARK
ncbi:MAG: quercetin dioxygenase-like cupin family protein [Gammaproteobacteria bacterium]|jgi:quercetin dioxygenase-like cupin family protein